MTSKAERRRRKAAQHARGQSQGQKVQALRAVEKRTRAAVRATLTPEQHKKPGYRTNAQGHVVRLDLIGVLHEDGFLSDSEEQAARRFQELRRDYEYEMRKRGFRCTLEDSAGGFDNGDGRPEVVREYRRCEDVLGPHISQHLVSEIYKTADESPFRAHETREALRTLAGVA